MQTVEDYIITNRIRIYLSLHPDGARSIDISNDLNVSIQTIVLLLQELKFNGIAKRSDRNDRWYLAN